MSGQMGKYSVTERTDKMVEDAREQNNITLLQRVINLFTNDLLKLDGYIGPVTRTKLRSVIEEVGERRFSNIFYKMLNSVEDYQMIMDYLAKAEGTRIHYNRGERSFTTAYGVYKHAWKHSKPVQYVEYLGKKYNIDVNTRHGARRINRYLTTEEEQKLKDLAYIFYMENFVNVRVNDHFEQHRMVKSKLTYFSNGVNAGVRTANRSLQKAIGVRPDGHIGKQTLTELKNHTNDKQLNGAMVAFMYKYYASLLRRNPAKYRRFMNGWNNRLASLEKGGK